MTYKKKREIANKLEPILSIVVTVIASVGGCIAGYIIFHKFF